MAKYPETLQKLTSLLKKLPGVGQKTAERFSFQIISWKEGDRTALANILLDIKKNLCTCSSCGALYENTISASCPFCNNNMRDKRLLCIVSSPKDIFQIELTRIYNGLYHTLPRLLSPIDGFGPENIGFDLLKKRIIENEIKEVILALDATIEGDATALYLKRELLACGTVVSRLALGMPLGSSLEYLDEGTLAQALSSRLPV